MSDDTKEYVILSLLSAFVIAFLVGIILMFNYVSDEHEKAQRNQDKCVAAGGLWIQNRNTEGYCYNK